MKKIEMTILPIHLSSCFSFIGHVLGNIVVLHLHIFI